MQMMQRRKIDDTLASKTFSSLREFLVSDPASLPDGVYEVDHGLPLFLNWKNRNSDTTVVTFTAAATRQMTTVPVFSGSRTTSHLSANVLSLIHI